MADKQLTVRLRLDANQFESQLNRITSKINQMNAQVNRGSAGYAHTSSRLGIIRSRVTEWYHKQRLVNRSLASGNTLLSTALSRMRSLAYTYLGIMGARAAINTSDAITSAENKINYVVAQQKGDSAFDSSGNYSQEVLNTTQQSLDKMYASSQKVRSSYTDMMTNVSKSMVLAGDYFQNNVDNAIRFQEIMAEAYAVGGATAQEMSTSMGQMIQALGGNLLAGDELRSVREGAPLAYQEIEKFAQKVYNSEKSLKDLAAEGKITSDIVVSAIMKAGDKIDSAFGQTKQTFAQTWDQIKNAATKAFEPVAQKFNEALNNAIDNGLITRIEQLFTNIAKAVLIVVDVVTDATIWFVDNWNWIKEVLIAGLSVLISYFVVTKTVAIASAIASAMAWISANWWLLVIIGSLALIIYGFYLVTQGALTMSEYIVLAVEVIALAFLIAGLIMGSVPMMIIAGILAVLALVWLFFEQVCYCAGWLVAVILDCLSAIWDFIVAIIQAIVSLVLWVLLTIYNIFAAAVNACIQLVWSAFVEPFIEIIEFILNVCNGGFNSFGGAVANLIGQIIGWFLSLGTVVTKIIDAIFGTNWTGGLNSLKDKVIAWGKNEESITLNREAPELKRANIDNTLNGWISTTDKLGTGFINPNELGSKWGNWGADLKVSVNDALDGWGSKFNSSDLLNKLSLDNIGKNLGLDFSNFGNLPNGSAYDTAGAYNFPDNLGQNVKDTAENTGSMAKSMELTEEDLAYLRKLADMEWKKEFTTANITVDMSNYNTINGESDLDGIVTKLADKLYEEMNVVANGVYM